MKARYLPLFLLVGTLGLGLSSLQQPQAKTSQPSTPIEKTEVHQKAQPNELPMQRIQPAKKAGPNVLPQA